jgi:hypothetical protein
LRTLLVCGAISRENDSIRIRGELSFREAAGHYVFRLIRRCAAGQNNGNEEKDEVFSFHGLPNVDMIRANDGAARASHETCLRQASDPVIG